MSTAEENPILIPSEDEEEDGDDVQYIKEEKAPPITIDETEDQDDVIFVSTCPAPPPTLPPTWDEALDSMDLDSLVTLGTPASSCSTDLPSLQGSSGPDTPFCPISAMLDTNSPPSVAINSTDLASVSGGSSDLSSVSDTKLPVPILDSDLSVGTAGDLAGSDLAVGDGASDLAAISSSVPTGSGLPLQNDLSSVNSVGGVSADLSGGSGLNMPSVSATNGVCSSPVSLAGSKTVMASNTSHLFTFQSADAFHAATGPLDLSQQDKALCRKWQRKKKKRGRTFVPSVTDPDSSSSSSSSNSSSSSSSSGDSNSNEDSDEQDDCSRLSPTALQGKDQSSGATATSCSSSLSGWWKLALSPTPLLTSNSVTPSSTSSPMLPSSVDVMISGMTQNHSKPSVIPPSPPVGAITTTASQVSFSCKDLTQTPGNSLTQASSSVVSQAQTSVAHTLSLDKSNKMSAGTAAKKFVSSTNGNVTQQLVSDKWLASQGSGAALQTQSTVQLCQQMELHVAQTLQQQKQQAQQQQQQQQQAGSSNGAQASPTSSSFDFLDKLVGDCESILLRNAMPTKGLTPAQPPSSIPAVSKAGSTPVSVSSTSGECKPSDKVTKRPSSSSLTSLDSSSLPPRKRVLMHSTSYSSDSSTAVSVSPTVVPASLLLDQANPSSSLTCTTSYSATDQSQDTSLVSGSGSNLKQLPQTGGSGDGLCVPVASTSGKRGSVTACNKCQAKEGEKSDEGEECKISLCHQGHAACGTCLLVEAKRILTGKQKESLKCVEVNCTSFYPTNELKNSLPPVIVDILQERFDQDVVEYIDNMMTSNAVDNDDSTVSSTFSSKKKKAMTRRKSSQSKQSNYFLSSSSDADDEDEENSDVGIDRSDPAAMEQDSAETEKLSKGRRLSSGVEEDQNDFPSHWVKMDNNKNLVEVVAVPLEPDSAEYIQVAVRFHEHMQFPAADITRIVRIQNPYLWKSYSLKKEQMIQENGGRVVNEYQLFHGTKVNTIDAICRRGFDWRFCGKHGTAYGQGCYFAGDSLYSNAYTDRGSTPSSGSVFLKSIMQATHSNDPSVFATDTSQIASAPPQLLNLPQPQRSSHSVAGGSGSNHLSSKASLAIKKLLPLLRGKQDRHAWLAQLLKNKSARPHSAAAAHGGGYSTARPGSSSLSMPQPPSGNLMFGPSRPTSAGNSVGPSGSNGSAYGPGRVGPCPLPAGGQPNLHVPNPASAPQPASHHALASSRHQHGHPQTSTPSQRHGLYSHQRYSLLANARRPHPSTPSSAGQSFPQGQSTGIQGVHSGQQAMHLPSGPSQGPGPKTPGYAAMRKSCFPNQAVKKYVARASSFNSGSGVGKVPALMVRSSSSQPLTGQGNGNVVVPVGNYPTSLSVATTAVTLSGVGAQSLALLTANHGSSSVQGNSFVLVAPLAPPPNPNPLPPLASLPPPPPQLLNQPGALPNGALPHKPGSWNGVGLGSSSAASQALDLRKSGSNPRYMFLAKVLTGMATGGQSDYRRPPPLDPSDPLGRCYDSCVDNIHTPRIWVIFDSTQAYPEYAIEYHVNGDLYR